MKIPRVIILFGGRFFSEKASALFAHLEAESFVKIGAQTTLVTPRRLQRRKLPSHSYTHVYLPAIDLTAVPLLQYFAGYINTFFYAIGSFFWILWFSKPGDVIISNEALPLLLATYVPWRRTIYELHDFADRSLWLYKPLFTRARFILATNEWKKQKLIKDFSVPAEKIFVERNGVDVEAFGRFEKNEAREKLGLSKEKIIAMYTGHLYGWKGVDTLAKAAPLMPDIEIFFVGGTEQDVARFKKQWGSAPNIRIIGFVPHDEIPLWQSAADVLVLPNSAKEEISVHYTSPMKLFEYIASGRPIVASDLPSIREILPENAGLFAVPDDPRSFAKQIATAATRFELGAASRHEAKKYSWNERARRILERFV